MVLPAEDVERFYTIWLGALTFVQRRTKLAKNWPEAPATPRSLQIADVAALRDALWADDRLLDDFLSENPAELAARDLAVAAGWKYRVVCEWAIVFKQLQKHTVVIATDGDGATRGYAVLGLVSALGEILPELPMPADLVLLPFEGRIVFDSVLRSANVFLGSGYRASYNDLYRDLLDSRGLIASLPPDRATLRPAVRKGNERLLKTFRTFLASIGQGEKIADRDVAALKALAEDLAAEDPPRPLLELNYSTAKGWVHGHPEAATAVKRFARFLYDTGRGSDAERVIGLQEIRRRGEG